MLSSKEQIETLAKENAFEYEPKWWNDKPHKHVEKCVNGDIVTFYRNHHIYNGVIGLWAKDDSHAVIFYATPHDVADEKTYSWIAPVFRVTISRQYIYPVPAKGKAINYLEDENGTFDEPQQPIEDIGDDTH